MRLEKILTGTILATTLYCGHKISGVEYENEQNYRAYLNCREHASYSYCIENRPYEKSGDIYLLGLLFGCAVLAGSTLYHFNPVK